MLQYRSVFAFVSISLTLLMKMPKLGGFLSMHPQPSPGEPRIRPAGKKVPDPALTRWRRSCRAPSRRRSWRGRCTDPAARTRSSSSRPGSLYAGSGSPASKIQVERPSCYTVRQTDIIM
jgi:hypothetical protein